MGCGLLRQIRCGTKWSDSVRRVNVCWVLADTVWSVRVLSGAFRWGLVGLCKERSGSSGQISLGVVVPGLLR